MDLTEEATAVLGNACAGNPLTEPWVGWVLYDESARRGGLSPDPKRHWMAVCSAASRDIALAAAARVAGGTGRVAAYTWLNRPGWTAAGRHLPLRTHIGGADERSEAALVQRIHDRWPVPAFARVEVRCGPTVQAATGPLTADPGTYLTDPDPAADGEDPARLMVGSVDILAAIIVMLREVPPARIPLITVHAWPLVELTPVREVTLAHPWAGHRPGDTVTVTDAHAWRLAAAAYLVSDGARG